MLLRNGSKGAAVAELQANLNRYGAGLRADGVFGAATDAAVRRFQDDHGLEVDGLAGPDTMAALACGADESTLCRPPAPELPDVLKLRVARARSATLKGIRYKLARGGYHPGADLPGRAGDPATDDGIGCDCSGFVAWCLGLRRGPLPHPPPAWIETSQVYRDATGPQRLFRRLAEPVAGCVVVYPDAGGDQGHIGIVTETAPELRGVDCSSSRSRRTGQAITERGLAFFRDRGAIFALLVTDPTPGN